MHVWSQQHLIYLIMILLWLGMLPNDSGVLLDARCELHIVAIDITRTLSNFFYCYKCKEKFVILKSIRIIAVKQGQSSTPVDIPVKGSLFVKDNIKYIMLEILYISLYHS